MQPPTRIAQPSRVSNMNRRSRLRRSVARGLKNPEPMPWRKAANLLRPCRRLPRLRRCVELGKPAGGQAIRRGGRSQAHQPIGRQGGAVSSLPDEIPALPTAARGWWSRRDPQGRPMSRGVRRAIFFSSASASILTTTSERLSPPPRARERAFSIRNSVASRGDSESTTDASSVGEK